MRHKVDACLHRDLGVIKYVIWKYFWGDENVLKLTLKMITSMCGMVSL